MVLFGGCAWFYSGGVRGFIWGGMRGFIRGVRGFIWGACMVLFGGAWFYSGGACVVLSRGGMRGFSSFSGYNEIRSMSRRYASYWNAFLLMITLPQMSSVGVWDV